MLYYASSIRDILKELGTSEYGLPTSEVSRRLQRNGENVISSPHTRTWIRTTNPFVIFFSVTLIIAALISIWIGAVLDGGIILIIVTISAVLYFVQQYISASTLQILHTQNPQSVLVTRDGTSQSIDIRKLVIGDIITLHEGEHVPADARLITSRTFYVNESQLTGETSPVAKQTEALQKGKAIYEQTNMVFRGSYVTNGDGTAVVVAVGNNTEFGHTIALANALRPQNPLQQKINRLTSWIISGVVAVAIVAFTLSLAKGMDLIESLQLVIALLVSALPESLPIALPIILALGLRRMAARKAIVRTMQSIEAIGNVTAIVSGETGMFTTNLPTVTEAWHPDHIVSHLHATLLHAINRGEGYMNPVDDALLQFLSSQGHTSPSQHALLSLPFDQKTMLSGNLWHSGKDYSLYIKGAPEQVLIHCDLTEGEHEQALAKIHSLASDGHKVIALAHTSLKKPLSSFSELNKKERLTFDGLVAISDQISTEAKTSIAAAREAHIKVFMATGSHFETAFHIGKQLGIVTTRNEVFDARHLSVVSDNDLMSMLDTVRIFAHTSSEQRYRITTLLKQHNTVALIASSVDDAPALTTARVGITMQQSAQVAKDASDLILLENGLKGVLNSIREGRVILANIRRMLVYLLATNAGEMLAILGALALSIPIPLLPAQILWANLITGGILAIPLGLEPGERNIMTHKSHIAESSPIDLSSVLRISLVAVVIGSLTLVIYMFYASYSGVAYGRTIAFSSLIIMQWASAIALRSDRGVTGRHLRTNNKLFYLGLAIAITVQIIALLGPLSTALQISKITIGDFLTSGFISLSVPILLIDLHKYLQYRSSKR